MFRCLSTAVFVVVISIPLAAQEPLWSGTMTAERHESPAVGVVVGYNGSLALLPPIGELSDHDFDLHGTMHEVAALGQIETSPLLEDGGVLLSLAPFPEPEDLELMTLTVDGMMLHLRDSSDLRPLQELLLWSDPGFRWTDGQTVAAALTMAQPTPALPLAAAALLALLLGAGAYRRVAGRNRRETAD